MKCFCYFTYHSFVYKIITKMNYGLKPKQNVPGALDISSSTYFSRYVENYLKQSPWENDIKMNDFCIFPVQIVLINRFREVQVSFLLFICIILFALEHTSACSWRDWPKLSCKEAIFSLLLKIHENYQLRNKFNNVERNHLVLFFMPSFGFRWFLSR